MRSPSIPALPGAFLLWASLLSLPAGAQSTVVQEGRLLEAVPETGSTLGTSVSISGGRIAVGDADPGRTGQVFTYVTQAGLWQPEIILPASKKPIPIRPIFAKYFEGMRHMLFPPIHPPGHTK